MLWTENREDYGWIRSIIKGHPWAFIAPSLLFLLFGGGVPVERRQREGG